MSNRKTTPHTQRRHAQFQIHSSAYPDMKWRPALVKDAFGYFYSVRNASTIPYVKTISVAISLRLAAMYRRRGQYRLARQNVQTATYIRKL